jgi:hypothetical protein
MLFEKKPKHTERSCCTCPVGAILAELEGMDHTATYCQPPCCPRSYLSEEQSSSHRLSIVGFLPHVLFGAVSFWMGYWLRGIVDSGFFDDSNNYHRNEKDET